MRIGDHELAVRRDACGEGLECAWRALEIRLILHGPPRPSGVNPSMGSIPSKGARVYGRIVTVLITGGVIGWLISPSAPSRVGVSASASTTSIPFVTRAKMT
jgi:hypothetical protein